jgi:sugar phosphate isomerase/epimerase
MVKKRLRVGDREPDRFAAFAGCGKRNVLPRTISRALGEGPEYAGSNIRVARSIRPPSKSMSLTRCISSLGCAELSLDETLALAARHGVATLELRALGGLMDLPRYLAGTYGKPEVLAARLRGVPVRIVAFDTSWHLVGDAPEAREQLLGFLPWAEALGAKWLRVFDAKGGLPEAEALRHAAESVRWWRGVKTARGVQADIMVETHDMLYTAAAVQRFVAAAPGTAILWDAHHTWRKGGEHPVATWHALREHIVHIHVKDSIPVPSARHPYTYVLPGEGGFPIAPLLSALRADRFAGSVCLEWERVWHPYLEPLESALVAAAGRQWWPLH